MKKYLHIGFAMLISGSAFAVTDHFVLRDGSHVYHLKISTVAGGLTVAADVDFEPTAEEKGEHACSASVAGDAKMVSDTELVMKKQVSGETRYCSLDVKLTPAGATVEQSEGCVYFAAGICHFDTQGKELIKIK
ncbi:MAG: hypothetical protein ACU836_08525 [Gammaproteobacteria bacterium]